MHGVVPRVLWEPIHPADAQHRIELVARALVVDVDGAGVRALVEVGLGQRWSDKDRARFAVAPGPSAREALRGHGIDPDSITHVVLTHLHWDHAGGLLEPDGALAFPRAEHVVGERALAHAGRAGPKDRGSFHADVVAALTARARLRVLSPAEREVAAGVEARWSDGHTPGLLVPFVPSRDDGPPLAFPTDLVPTRSHLRPAWVAAYDNEPARSADEKAALFTELARVGGGLALYHDPFFEAAWTRPGTDALEPGSIRGLS